MSNPKQCRHEGSVSAQFLHDVQNRHNPPQYLGIGCNRCGTEFDPQELVNALVYYADKVIGVNTEEGSIELVTDYGKRARKALGWEKS